MNSNTLLIWILIIVIAYSTTSARSEPEFLINCGLPKSTTATSSVHNTVWESDDNPAFITAGISSTSTVSAKGGGSDVPYTTARVFRSLFSYSFRLNTSGPIFLRLYFAASRAPYDGISASQVFFSLLANGLTLLRDFSPYLNSRQPCSSANSGPPVYEFQLLLEHNSLNLTFSPGNGSSCNGSCYGYVNGIEITAVPAGLYLNKNETENYVTNPNVGYSLSNTSASQTACRLNVGGSYVPPRGDAGGMGRAWYDDDPYLTGRFKGNWTYTDSQDGGVEGVTYSKIPNYTAPAIVYATQRFIGLYKVEDRARTNLTWGFEVDPGFDYLVRLHLCEHDLNVTGSGQREFYVYLNGATSGPLVDVWQLAGGRGSPVYLDYVVHVDAQGVGNRTTTTKAPLNLVLQPVRDYMTDVLLNGVEVLKLNQPNGSLAAPNLLALDLTPGGPNPAPNPKGSSHLAVIGGMVGGVALVSLLVLACLVINKRRRRPKGEPLVYAKVNMDSSTGTWIPASALSGSTKSSVGPSLPSDLCHRFTLAQIRAATSDFDEALVIGTGGFGKVYRGSVNGGAATVAVKRLNPMSKQGAHEFVTEIEMLSRLRHHNLVALIGYCEDGREMILVYEYMPRGTLRDHLLYKHRDDDGDKAAPLTWKQRLGICVGSARGLHYLHAGTTELIIHRDVKSTNILLDERWAAKVSDFGLSKVGPAGAGHVSTAVKGSVGYLDPEYFKRQRLTEKSDVYSFGVVMFEVLCGRAAVDPHLPREQVNLAMWARGQHKRGALGDIVDPNLAGQIAPECLSKFGETAEMCVRDHGAERPSMHDVVGALEFALQLQLTAEENNVDGAPLGGGVGGTDDDEVALVTAGDKVVESSSNDSSKVGFDSSDASTTTATTTTTTTATDHHVDMRSASVFSEIFNPQAR